VTGGTSRPSRANEASTLVEHHKCKVKKRLRMMKSCLLLVAGSTHLAGQNRSMFLDPRSALLMQVKQQKQAMQRPQP
jgi:hypothetical protein